MDKFLIGKTALITGSNQGLGLEIAKTFARAGANLMLCARSNESLIEATNIISSLIDNSQTVEICVADISIQTDVTNVVTKTIKKFGSCQILVNNAGIYGPKGFIENNDWIEWTKTIEINVYGSVMMARTLIPHFKAQKYGKIIQLSGGGATNPLPNLSAYAVSKAAIIRFMESIALELQEFGIEVNAIAPGALNTQMLEEIIKAGPELVGKSFYEKSLKQKQSGGAPLEIGAELTLFLASDQSKGITGKLISAQWDDWKDFPNHLDELNKSDIYTLRRIVARDRGFNWGDK
jgi:3-oxoacyl-[acyl-carrier protein] reductase